jgi:hypothetical protein
MGKVSGRFRRKAVALLVVTVGIILCEKWRWQQMAEAQAPLRVQLRPATLLKLPGQVDCNSPAHWDGETLYVFTSAGHPFRSFGRNLFSLGEPQSVRFNNEVNGGALDRVHLASRRWNALWLVSL